MTEIKLPVPFKTLQHAIRYMRAVKMENGGEDCYMLFNGKRIDSSMSINECFLAVTGKDYFEYKHDKFFEEGFPTPDGDKVDLDLDFVEMMSINSALGFYKKHLTNCEQIFIEDDDKNINRSFCSWLTDINEQLQIIQNLYDKISSKVCIQSIEEEDGE